MAEAASVQSAVKKLHEAIVGKDVQSLKTLFHPDFERYFCGVYSKELYEGYSLKDSLVLLWKHGNFSKFNITEPVGNQYEGKLIVDDNSLRSSLFEPFFFVFLFGLD